ncbi:MAG: Carboxypeptidase regulatory-like domain [Firmicutes bacterium]|nr:Carboxypeptidase regulatory-like domain [Bacillota bacterium]
MASKIFKLTSYMVVIFLIFYFCPVALAAVDNLTAKPHSYQQQEKITVSGAVYDENRHPVAGVTVKIGRAKARTDAQGKYSVKIKPGDHPVRIRSGRKLIDFDILTFIDSTQLDLGFQKIN